MRSIMHMRKGPLAAAAALAAIALVLPAQAQYPQYGAPYSQPVQSAQPGVQQAPPVYSQTQPYTQPQQYTAAAPYTQPTAPQYGGTGVYQGYTPAAGYVSPYSAPRVAMAYQQPTPGGDNLPLTPPVESVAPGVPQSNYGIQPTPMPAADSYSMPTPGYPAPGVGGADCNCQGGAANYGSYGGGGCDPSAYGACSPYSSCNTSPVCPPARCGGYWFGGVYGLFMDRDDANKYSLAYVTDPSMPTAYPTTPANVVMTTRSVDTGFQPGVEFRLGRAFGGIADPCGCCSCGPQWGLEAAYWTLFDDDDYAEYVNPTGTSRTYTMMPMYGLQYDHGAGYMPINEYWDHGMPSMPANPIRVTRIRQSSSFEAQNLEINLLRLGVCGGGCGSASFSACGGMDACAGGCTDGCCAPRGSRYSCTAVCGFRWMQLDEDFMFGVDYTNPAWPTPSGYLNYWSNVENNLIGAQLGCNGMYRIGCKWGLHVNTLVGVYGNDIDVRQYFQSPTGLVQYTGTGEAFDVSASKTDVAMLGELRLGASYQATCRMRLYGGWRAIGVTGIALATDQTPNAFLSSAQMANYVNSNGSMILHGLQAGVEWNY